MTELLNYYRSFNLCPKLFVLFLLYGVISSFLTPQYQLAMKDYRTKRTTEYTSSNYNSSTRLNAIWFFGRDKKKKKKNSNGSDNSISPPLNMPNGSNNNDINQQGDPSSSGMATTVNAMKNFKKSQEIGRRTNAILQDLASSTIEGIGAEGKVKVFLNGQQEPIGVEVDADYLAAQVDRGNTEELNEALTGAMRDAWGKSLGIMQDKMQSLYSELDLPSAKS